jgi:hypothetical protein
VYSDSVHNPTKQNAVPILFVAATGLEPALSIQFTRTLARKPAAINKAPHPKRRHASARRLVCIHASARRLSSVLSFFFRYFPLAIFSVLTY